MSEVFLPIGQIDKAYLATTKHGQCYYVGVVSSCPDSPLFVETTPPRKINEAGFLEMVPVVPPEQVGSARFRPAQIRYPVPPVMPEELGSVELKRGKWQVSLQRNGAIVIDSENVAIKNSGEFVTPPLIIDRETQGEWLIIAGADKAKHRWLYFPPLGYWLLTSKQFR